MFQELFGLGKKQQPKKVSKSKAKAHRFTVNDDIKLVKSIVEGRTYKQVAKVLKVTPSQVQSRIVKMAREGLTFSRLNNTQEIVTVNLLKTNMFTKKFTKEVEKLVNTCARREVAHVNNGDVKVIYKTWTLAELNTIKFYGMQKTASEYAEMFNRPVNAVRIKLNEVLNN